MGQKVNPNVIRLGITKLWTSNWFANKKNFSQYLYEDYQIRQILLKELSKAMLSKIVIERLENKIRILLYSARPGIIFSRKYDELVKLRYKIEQICYQKITVQFTVTEVDRSELDANLVAENIAFQLKKRIIFRRIMKRAVQNAMKRGAEGMKVELSGRLSGVEIARTEWYREGRVPLHTFIANIDYCCTHSLTTYGVIGIKVWIFKSDTEEEKLSTEKQKNVFMKTKGIKDIKKYAAT